jgi:hypothetical protein
MGTHKTDASLRRTRDASHSTSPISASGIEQTNVDS